MRRKRGTLITFTILSSDPKKSAIRFLVPNRWIRWSGAGIVLFAAAFCFSTYMNIHQQEKITRLAAELAEEKGKNAQLTQAIGVLEKKSGETIRYLEELAMLEQQVRSYINELPEVIEPTGGVHISLEQSGFENTLDATTKTEALVERYKETLALIGDWKTDLASTPTAWPTVPNVLTSDFGVRQDPFYHSLSFHSGIDIRGYYGTPVFATADGEVVDARYFGGYGNMIKIRHSGEIETVYGHLSAIHVKPGEKVRKGQTIGEIGSTGRSTGPHLHYEVLKNGKPVDPKSYIIDLALKQ